MKAQKVFVSRQSLGFLYFIKTWFLWESILQYFQILYNIGFWLCIKIICVTHGIITTMCFYWFFQEAKFARIRATGYFDVVSSNMWLTFIRIVNFGHIDVAHEIRIIWAQIVTHTLTREHRPVHMCTATVLVSQIWLHDLLEISSSLLLCVNFIERDRALVDSYLTN